MTKSGAAKGGTGVLPVTLASFELNKTKLYLIAGGNAGTVTANTFVGTDGNPSSATVTWSKKDGVDLTNSTTTPAGNTVTVTPGTAGSFILRATAEGVSQDCEVVISDLDPYDYPSTPPDGITVGLGGVFCYDVRSSYADDADYPLTVIGQKSLDKVTWVITDTRDVQRVAATLTNTNAHLELNDYFYVRQVLAPAEITITAYIDLTLPDETKEKTSVSKTIKFRNAACCPGYTAENGAFTGSIPQQLSGNLNVEQVLDAFANATRSDLCISPDVANGVHWYIAREPDWCNTKVHALGGDWADRNNNWRLPNIAELAHLQTTLWTQESPPASAIYSSTYPLPDDTQTRIMLWTQLSGGHTGATDRLNSNNLYHYICVRTTD